MSSNPFGQRFTMNEDTLTTLLALLDMTNVSVEAGEENNLDVISESVNNVDSGWLRSGERWDAQSARFESKREDILNLAAELGFIHEIGVKRNDFVYDRPILLGASSFIVQKRLSHMINSWESGSRWKVMVFLGSDRSLDGPESDRLVKHNVMAAHFPPTEMGMMRYIYSQSLDMAPKSFRDIPVLFINTESDIGGRRAVTEDTIHQWLREDEGMECVRDILVFSNQPYVLYQDQVVKHALRQGGAVNVHVNTVGEGLTQSASPTLLLDTIARFIFFLNKNSKESVVMRGPTSWKTADQN